MGIKFANFASAMGGPISAADVSIAVDNASAFPALAPGDYFYAVLVDNINFPTKREIIRVDALAGNVLSSITRGVDGTTAQAFDIVYVLLRWVRQAILDVGSGAVAGALLAANNLSDVANAGTSRTNLGIGVADTPTFGGLNISGDATVGGDLAVTGVISSPYFPIKSVFDYMTVPQIVDVLNASYTIDVSGALINAFTAGIGYLPKGGYLCNNSIVIPVADGLSIQGDSPEDVFLRFAVGVNGLDLTYSDSQFPPSIRGITVATNNPGPGVANVGISVELSPLVGTAYRQGPLIDNVQVRGFTPTAMGWATCIDLTGCWYPTVLNTTLKGYSAGGAALNTYQTSYGIAMHDVMAPYFDKVVGQHINTFIYENGSTYPCEGYTITNCQVVGCRTGIDIGNGVGTPVPGGWIKNFHADASLRGIILNNRIHSMISDALLYRTITTTEAFIGVLLASADNNIIRGINVSNASADTTPGIGIYLSSSDNNIVSGFLADTWNAASSCLALAGTSSNNVADLATFKPGPSGTIWSKVTKVGGFTGTGNVLNDFINTAESVVQNNYYGGFIRIPGSAGSLLSNIYFQESVNGLQYIQSTVTNYPQRQLVNIISDATCSQEFFDKYRGTPAAPAAAVLNDSIIKRTGRARNAAGTLKNVYYEYVILTKAESANEFGSTYLHHVSKAGTGLVETYRVDEKGIQHALRNRQKQGADVAAANDLTLGDGNLFQVTGNTQINRLVSTDWPAGSEVTLYFSGTPTVKHNQAGAGDNRPMLLAGAVDFVASANATLTLVLCSDSSWREKCRTVI